MDLKLATADYSFPKLRWEQALRLARDLEMRALDIGLFAGRTHLDPAEVLSHLPQSAARVSTALRDNNLEIADVFGQPGQVFEENAVNHPDPAVRRNAAEFFHRILEFAIRCNAKHLTLLPGVHFDSETYEDSLKRCVEELSWRAQAAAKMGVVFSVEAHVGSIAPTPAQAKRLVESVPGLTLTLDYTHFTLQGFSDDDIEPLLASASHFHARGACKGKLQASVTENTIDYARVLRAMKRANYAGFVVLEYVWTEWMGCNQVDNLSETILLRDLVRSAYSAA
ncbi:MAG TPA: sugar phosphate isomerase/epimerase family protein [Terriglobia bacterium]|nr:sugar phosphate isomerase/epimerase family protein [Terriglobia bacterium]